MIKMILPEIEEIEQMDLPTVVKLSKTMNDLYARYDFNWTDEVAEKWDAVVKRTQEFRDEPTQKLTQKEKAGYAFFSGLIMGWASRLKDIDVEEEYSEILKLIDEMEDESRRIAKLSGVTVK